LPGRVVMFRCNNKNFQLSIILTLVLSLVILFSFTGCETSGDGNAPASGSLQTDGEGGTAQEVPSNSRKPVTAPVEVLYTVKNPLDIVSEVITEGTDEEGGIQVRHEVIRISGLVDKEVENKINDRIQEVYEGLKTKSLPPFRGIRIAIPENALLVEDYIYIAEMVNFNNVLSVWFNRSATYALPGATETPDEGGSYLRDSSGFYHNTRYVFTQEALNFDLNTGNEITLKDVFADNVDHLALLNDAVSRQLNESSAQEEGYFIHWYGLKLAESFKGLSPDQKYLLRPFGISLIFDYNTPEFYLPDFMAQTIDVSYGELDRSVAITERFYNEEENIFLSDDPPVRELMSSDYIGVPVKKQEYTDGGVNVYNYVQTSPQFPEQLMEKVMDLSNIPKERLDNLKRVMKEEDVNWNEETNGYFEQRVSTAIVGPYASITRHMNGGAKDYWFFSMEYNTFDLESGKELVLSDMFTPGFDYIPLVRKGIEKTVSENGGIYRDGNRLTPEETEQELDRILSGTLSFCPNTDSIQILAGDVEYAGFRREPLSINLSFGEIGYENLKAFIGL